MSLACCKSLFSHLRSSCLTTVILSSLLTISFTDLTQAFPSSLAVPTVITLVRSRGFTTHFRGVVFLFLSFFSNCFTVLGVLDATCPAVLHSELICLKCQLCACCLAHAVSSHISLVPLQCSEWFPFFTFPFYSSVPILAREII